MSCGICLSRLKEPVSVPCGHVYCTDCLTSHVSATSPDGFTSTCPSCRETFNMVRPELTCLPKKFHQFVVPSIRRVYIDMSRHDRVRQRLAASEARVKALESDKERLLAVCERHSAAADAHSRGETDALLRVRELEEELESAREAAEGEVQDAERALQALKGKYAKMKRHCRALEASRKGDSSVAEGPSFVGKRNSSLVDLSVDEAASPVSPKRLRVIRPLPRSRQSLETPVKRLVFPERAHYFQRPRQDELNLRAEPYDLGSPFRS
ncbi:hypothetical protein B0H17DRAFT_1007612 [Mycena rosella]|uniref:RING-type domain-containing protein n=1 Tax=Mycena rosella TaxID=1033263 RepID=A0AAD7GIK0_MYCRO|nr:hypothetical protein B0H17DRAFT_1007612 [Mycena rosella]